KLRKYDGSHHASNLYHQLVARSSGASAVTNAPLLDSLPRHPQTVAMPVAATKTKSIYLIGGADEFSIKETAAKLADKLAPKKAGEFGLEIIEGSATNQ